jgi:hypothetical protein
MAADLQSKPRRLYTDDTPENDTIEQAQRTNEWLRDGYDDAGEKEKSDLYGFEGPEEEEI